MAAVAGAAAPFGGQRRWTILAVVLGQAEPLPPCEAHQQRRLVDRDPLCVQIPQPVHPIDLFPAHRDHRHQPRTPQGIPPRVTSETGTRMTSLSGCYRRASHNLYYGTET